MRTRLNLLLLGVVAFALVARAMAPAWMLLALSLPYLVIVAIHAGVHWRMTKRAEPGKPPLGIAVSHILLIAGFLLQFDGGDAPVAGESQYYPVTALLGLGTWSAAPAGWVIALNRSLTVLSARCADGFVWLGVARDRWAGWSLYELALFLPVAISWLVLLWRSHAIASAPAQ
jgi:hypothetical protein